MKNTSEYKIYLVAKNEGIKYIDSYDIYRFGVSKNGREFVLFLPGTKGSDYQIHDLSQEEYNRIIPRIQEYLKNYGWLSIFGYKNVVKIKCRHD